MDKEGIDRFAFSMKFIVHVESLISVDIGRGCKDC